MKHINTIPTLELTQDQAEEIFRLNLMALEDCCFKLILDIRRYRKMNGIEKQEEKDA